MDAKVFWIIFCSTELLLAAHYHGKPKTGTHNFFIALITIIFMTLIMYSAGAFN